MPHQIFIDKLHTRYNTPHRNLFLQSELSSPNFDEFMDRHQIQDEKECLCRMVEYLNDITPHLVDGFHTEFHKFKISLQCNTWQGMGNHSSDEYLHGPIKF